MESELHAQEIIDVFSLFEFSQFEAETGMLDLCSEEKYYVLARGWFVPLRFRDSVTPFAAATEKESLFRYKVLRPRPRWLTFEVGTQGPEGGPNSQDVEIFSGEERLDSFCLKGDVHKRRTIFIPQSLQRVGDNYLLFRFAELSRNPDFLTTGRRHFAKPYFGIAAHFRDIKIIFGREKRSGLQPRHGMSRRGRKTLEFLSDGRGILQKPESRFSVCVPCQPSAELVVNGQLIAPPGGHEGNSFVLIECRTTSDPRWRRLMEKSCQFESNHKSIPLNAKLPLDACDGEILQLRFGLTDSQAFSQVCLHWTALRIMTRARGASQEPGDREPVRLDTREIKNLIVIITDATRADYLGCYGNTEKLTPNIDNFSKGSFVFENAIAPTPMTTPSVASLFTGLQPETHQAMTIEGGFNHERFYTAAKAFRAKGFFCTAIYGNSAVGPEFGLTADFDEVTAIWEDESKGKIHSTQNLNAIEKTISRAANIKKPVFMYIHLLPPHAPYNPPPDCNVPFRATPESQLLRRWIINQMFDKGLIDRGHPHIELHRNNYKNNLAYADYLVGVILRLLRENSMYDNSLVVLSSDHGEGFGEHGLMEHTSKVYEEVIKVPLIVHFPGRAGARITEQVGLIDLLPTFIELFDLLEPEIPLTGVSITPLLAGVDSGWNRLLYSRAIVPSLNFSLRGERYKYIYYRNSDELFDLSNDPGETANIAASKPVLVSYLRQLGVQGIRLRESQRAETEETKRQLDDDTLRKLRNLGYIQ